MAMETYPIKDKEGDYPFALEIENVYVGPRAIGLGLDRKSITQKLGTPTAEKNNSVLYVYRKEQRMTVEQIERMAKLWPTVKEHPFADVSSDVELVFIDGKTVAVTISKLETY